MKKFNTIFLLIIILIALLLIKLSNYGIIYLKNDSFYSSYKVLLESNQEKIIEDSLLIKYSYKHLRFIKKIKKYNGFNLHLNNELIYPLQINKKGFLPVTLISISETDSLNKISVKTNYYTFGELINLNEFKH